MNEVCRTKLVRAGTIPINNPHTPVHQSSHLQMQTCPKLVLLDMYYVSPARQERVALGWLGMRPAGASPHACTLTQSVHADERMQRKKEKSCPWEGKGDGEVVRGGIAP